MEMWILSLLYGVIVKLGDDSDRALGTLVKDYHEGDELVIVGYSRGKHHSLGRSCLECDLLTARLGAYMSQVLAGLLDCVGLPQHQSEKRLKKYFQLFWDNKLDDIGVREQLKADHKCERLLLGTARAQLTPHEALEVSIQFLGCLDTVGSLGVPNTGLLTPLRWTPRLIKHLQFRDTKVPSSKDPGF